MSKTLVEGPPVYQRLRLHPTNDPTNPAHRLADDAKRMATGSYPANAAALQGIAEDIDAMLTTLAAQAGEIERMREALERLRDCDRAITPLGRMDAVRDVARQALTGKDG